MDEHLETLSAMLDGEPVEVRALEAALADPEARRGLVDFVRLRQAARTDASMPRASFSDNVRRTLTRRSRLARLRVPLPLAAAAVLLALLGGSLIEVKWPTLDREPLRPPQPSRVLEFDAPPANAGGEGVR